MKVLIKKKIFFKRICCLCLAAGMFGMLALESEAMMRQAVGKLAPFSRGASFSHSSHRVMPSVVGSGFHSSSVRKYFDSSVMSKPPLSKQDFDRSLDYFKQTYVLRDFIESDSFKHQVVPHFSYEEIIELVRRINSPQLKNDGLLITAPYLEALVLRKKSNPTQSVSEHIEDIFKEMDQKHFGYRTQK